MEPARPDRLDRPLDPDRDHVLGPADAPITVVEYGSYLCSYCHAAHEVVRRLRDDFGDRMRYAYRHLPLTDRHEATQAAELAEYAAATTGEFWQAHDALMRSGPVFHQGELDEIAAELAVPTRDAGDPRQARAAATRVREDARSGIRSGARVTPTFFINGRRYEGAWDEASLSEAMLRSLGHRLHSASLDFARWAPSTGLLLLLMTALALVLSNSPVGPRFLALWEARAGLVVGGIDFVLPLVDWVNHGLLAVFFLVVGLEIKRELTVGRLASPRAAAFPIAAAAGGMIVPAFLFLLLAPSEFHHGWGMTIATDTAFAVALIVLLGNRAPVELRVFLTAAVIVDDLVAIAIVALFYSGGISASWLAASAVVTGALVTINRWHVHRVLPYAALGLLLWFMLHAAGIHATLVGVILAIVTPTRPPANLKALLAQAQAVIDSETRFLEEPVLRTGPSEPALRALDAIHDRLDSPANKLLRAVEPWSSYIVLPVFALANAGVAWSPDLLAANGRLVGATMLGLVIGKPTGIFFGARLASRLGIGSKPAAFTWRQVAGAGALGGIGFTMSLFIASQTFTGTSFAAVKIAIFLASILAGGIGTSILWKRVSPERALEEARQEELDETRYGTPVSPAPAAEAP